MYKRKKRNLENSFFCGHITKDSDLWSIVVQQKADGFIFDMLIKQKKLVRSNQNYIYHS
jgi:hypothetical protein